VLSVSLFETKKITLFETGGATKKSVSQSVVALGQQEQLQLMF